MRNQYTQWPNRHTLHISHSLTATWNMAAMGPVDDNSQICCFFTILADQISLRLDLFNFQIASLAKNCKKSLDYTCRLSDKLPASTRCLSNQAKRSNMTD